jgi:DNA-binding NarL/FixJ family response regulator
MNVIKVAIADDHKIFRKGVILSLRQYTNIKFVQEADNGEDLIQGIAESNPEVVLLDLKMPVKDGIETTKYLNKHFPQMRIIILTMYEDERFVGHLMDSGANGYLLKSTDPTEIKKAITDVMRTGFYLNTFVNKVLIKKNYAKQKFNPNLSSEVVLSEREKEVLNLVCMEYTAQEIATKMEISARTVEAIKDRLMERFGVKNSVGLVFYAMKNSLID